MLITTGFKVIAQGNPGHGSRFIKATAVEKLVRIGYLRVSKF